MTVKEQERIIKRIKTTDTCWLWTGGHSHGYGHGYADKRNQPAIRG